MRSHSLQVTYRGGRKTRLTATGDSKGQYCIKCAMVGVIASEAHREKERMSTEKKCIKRKENQSGWKSGPGTAKESRVEFQVGGKSPFHQPSLQSSHRPGLCHRARIQFSIYNGPGTIASPFRNDFVFETTQKKFF